MKYLKIIFLLFSLQTIQNIEAEIIDGPANIRNKPNGTVICSLNDNTFIEIENSHNKWYSISLLFKLNSIQLKNGKMQNGDRIINNLNKTVGIFKADFKLTNISEKYKRNNIISHWAVLNAYTYKNNFKYILTKRLLALIKKGTIHYKNFTPILKANKFVKHKILRDSGNTYNIYIKFNVLTSPVSPTPSIFLIFKNGQLYSYEIDSKYIVINKSKNTKPIDKKILSIINYRP